MNPSHRRRVITALGTAAGLGLTTAALALSPTGVQPPANTAPGATAPVATGTTPTTGPPARGDVRPSILTRRIPYPLSRRREMAAYSRMHYGSAYADWRLRPQVIVAHYTATTGAQEVLNTFASDTPDAELGQLPGVCSHYLVDSDGTIMELVPPTIRCRHTVGLNHVAIGIEMVGTSDGDILGRPRQLASATALTRYLQARYGITTANVIGHSESLSSPFHRELYAPWRDQTHGDWSATAMRTFRTALGAAASAAPRR